MELASLQKTVDDWIKAHGGYFSELTNTVVLMEEVGELARHVSRTYGEQTYKANENPSGLSEELADVLFVLLCLANQTGTDLSEAILNSLEKKTSRDRERHKSINK